jgi:hypothetical protein
MDRNGSPVSRRERSPALTLVPPLPLERPADRRYDLTACSVCLRVRHGSDWIDADSVIRQLGSYEFEDAPRLEPALCDLCAASISAHRRQVESGDSAVAA